MRVNIIGSTGTIGSKSLTILKKNFPKYKINLLVANNNYRKLIKQIFIYKPKYVCLNNSSKIKHIKKFISNKSTKLILPEKLNTFLSKTQSDLTILSISGYHALKYFNNILINTNNLGLVNKECVVSAGHLFKKLIKRYKVNIYPLDSEHYSLLNFFKNKLNSLNYKYIYLTASGGPFYNYTHSQIKNVTYEDAINHPKWKMGYKNSIDSATMANKCLEIVEAHYLFDIPYNKLKILIHPQALIHSVIEKNNYTSEMNYFYHDMSIPLTNFFSSLKKNQMNKIVKNYNFNTKSIFNFSEVPLNKFPIFKIFKNINKKSPKNLIKFNCSNEFAVDLFKNNSISFRDIHKIIKWGLSLNLNFKVNNINNVIIYQKKFMLLLKSSYEN